MSISPGSVPQSLHVVSPLVEGDVLDYPENVRLMSTSPSVQPQDGNSPTVGEGDALDRQVFPASARRDPEEELADCRGKRIGILIVAYNAVTTLKGVLSRITPHVWKNVEEVMIFDDASQDATYELAVGLKALFQTAKLHVLKHDANLGYGGNQKAGYQYLIEKGFDIVVLLHGDGQYAPEILSHLYHPLVTGAADAVFGSRMMKTYGGALKGKMPLYKYVGNRILTWFENGALGMNLTEFHSGYRAYSLAALRQIDFSKMTNDFHFDTEIIIKLHHQSFRIHEVPIPTYYGNEICYVNGMKYAKNVFRAVRRYHGTVRSGKRAAEFSEYFIHYPIKKSKYSSHYYSQQFLAQGHQDVLELGCGEGFFARSVAEHGNRITGIDTLPKPADPEAFENFISADLSAGLPDLDGKRFDKILLMDVLEHISAPQVVLRDCRKVLKPHGLILVCVPNIANISVRLMLLAGRFNYTERGILDRTHLRFFTRKTAHQMLTDNGYEVVREMSTVIPTELALGVSADNAFMIAANRILAFFTRFMRGLLAYQHILIARPVKNDGN